MVSVKNLSKRKKSKIRIFLTGNWVYKNTYIGEPQKTLQQIMVVVNSQSKQKKIFKKSDLRREKSGCLKTIDKYLIFGSFIPLMIRFFFLLFQRVERKNIFFYFFKNKYSFKDFFNFLKSASFSKLRFLIYPFHPSIFEIFLPDFLYKKTIIFFSKKIIFASTLDCFTGKPKEKEKLLLGSCLEERRLVEIKRLAFFDKKLDGKSVKIVYFGRDDYLRGVDILADMNPRINQVTFQKFLYPPFKDYLWKNRQDLFQKKQPYLEIIYKKDDRILEKIRDATFSVFAFRTRRAGPDIPAALVEAFLLGVPPIISEVLYFEPLKKFSYPLVLKEINPQEIERIVVYSTRNENYYKSILKKCRRIADFFISNYSFKIESVAETVLNKMTQEGCVK